MSAIALLAAAAAAAAEGSPVSGLARRFALHATPERVFRINGDPKSGTTWFEFVVKEILRQHAAENPSCAFSQTAQEGRTYILRCPERVIKVSPAFKHGIPMVGGPEGMGGSKGPPELDDELLVGKAEEALAKTAVYWLPIFRDPRAVVNSACHHLGIADCGAFLASKISLTCRWINLRYRFFSQVVERSSGGPQAQPRARLTFYAALKENLASEVQGLSEYIIGAPLSARAADAVARGTSLQAMRRQEDAGRIPTGPRQVGRRIRSGEVCGFRNELGLERVSEATEIMRSILIPVLNRTFSEC